MTTFLLVSWLVLLLVSYQGGMMALKKTDLL